MCNGNISFRNLFFSKEQCKRCGVLVKCRHTAVYLCHVCRTKFSTQIGCKMHFYDAHPTELAKQTLPIFTCIEKCIKCNLEITVDIPDFAARGNRSSSSDNTAKKSSTSTKPPSKMRQTLRNTPCENCLTTFLNVDDFLAHLPCSKDIKIDKGIAVYLTQYI